MASNMAFIYQPHFKTKCFRVASVDQCGDRFNYIVVTCSPRYNGIWKYPASNVKMYSHWKNGKVDCICVPIDDCVLLQSLVSVQTESIRNKIKTQQENWYKNNIKNRDYTYSKKPEWFIQ